MQKSSKWFIASIIFFIPSLYILLPIITNIIILFAISGFAIGTTLFSTAIDLKDEERKEAK